MCLYLITDALYECCAHWFFGEVLSGLLIENWFQTLLRPSKSASLPSIGTPKIARPTSGTPLASQKIDTENEWTPQNRIRKKIYQPKTPITPLTPANKRTPGLRRVMSDTFQVSRKITIAIWMIYYMTHLTIPYFQSYFVIFFCSKQL